MRGWVSWRQAGRERGSVESRWSKDKKEESQRRWGGTRGQEEERVWKRLRFLGLHHLLSGAGVCVLFLQTVSVFLLGHCPQPHQNLTIVPVMEPRGGMRAQHSREGRGPRGRRWPRWSLQGTACLCRGTGQRQCPGQGPDTQLSMQLGC